VAEEYQVQNWRGDGNDATPSRHGDSNSGRDHVSRHGKGHDHKVACPIIGHGLVLASAFFLRAHYNRRLISVKLTPTIVDSPGSLLVWRPPVTAKDPNGSYHNAKAT